MTWLIDLDGVVWRGNSPIPGSAAAVTALQAALIDVAFVTNNSAMTAAGYADKLSKCGINATPAAVIHGGHAVARLVKEGQRVLVCAGDGVVEGMESRGVEWVSGREAGSNPQGYDAVIVGWLPDFSYDLMSVAVRAVLNGAALLAPSADPLYPADDGPKVGGGSLTMAISYATKTEPQFAAKPFAPMIEVIQERIARPSLVVGDQPFTDGRLAQVMELPFIHVTSGIGGSGVEVPIRAQVPDLAAAVELELGRQ